MKVFNTDFPWAGGGRGGGQTRSREGSQINQFWIISMYIFYRGCLFICLVSWLGWLVGWVD